ncbi:MAG TPA: hypothetical protein VNN08_00280 [Thermoanaerobaculia bacterium]|nr:hypothetical protein [Thermoanaerobaculia bacterium]
MTSSFALLLLLACNQPPAHGPLQNANVPKVHATAVTIRTTLQPANKTYTHTLFIANGRARSGDEVDEWRLFDFAQKRVTFVDDLAGTYRNETFADVLASHRAAVARDVPDGMPRAQFAVTGAQKTLQGVPARQSIIRLGAYQRELWIASHPLIPQGLFAMLQASDPVSSPLAGVMRAADEALLQVQGFPIADHAELPYENQKMVVDNAVVKIEQRDVPASFLNVRGSYRELNPAHAGAEQPVQAK